MGESVITLKAEDLDAAKDAAISCIRSMSNSELLIITHWHESRRLNPEDIEKALDYFQERVATIFGKLAAIYLRADLLLSKDICDAILTANCQDPAPNVDGRPVPTYHQAAVDSTHWFLWIPVSEMGPLDDVFDCHLADGSWIMQLEKLLADLNGVGRKDYWQRVVDHVAKHSRCMDPEETQTRIEREWKKARLRNEQAEGDFAQPPHSDGTKWSAPETMKAWCNRFEASSRSLYKWRKAGTLRMMKVKGRRGLWVVDEADPLYVGWNGNRTSLND